MSMMIAEKKDGFTQHLFLMRKGAGFTLVELLVVVAVIGILSGVVLVSMNAGGYLKRGRDSRRLAELGQIQTALELSFADGNHYPSTIPSGVPTVDPSSNSYLYCPHSPVPVGGTNYMEYEVCADLEIVTNSDAGCAQGLVTVAGGDNCTTNNCCLTNPF